MDPYKNVSTRATAQTEKARPDQVENSAGGFVFGIDDRQRFLRFLILGTDGGTYYTSERALTKDNAAVCLRLAESDGEWMVSTIRDVSLTNRAPKVKPTLFALAAAAGSSDKATRIAALRAIPDVCRTGTHLLNFAGYMEQFRGWGVAARKGVAAWYEQRTPDQLAYQLVKYRQREGWSHRDVLRLAHPRVADEAKGLLDFACGRDAPTGHPMVAAYVEAQSASAARAAELIREYRLPWEALPDSVINEPVVWEALLPTLGQTALIRQLPRLTRLGLLTPMSATAHQVSQWIADGDRLRKGRVHPMAVLLAAATYASGHGDRGKSTWTPTREVIDALDAAFYAAFGTVEPANRRTLLGLDVSGSMQMGRIAGTALTPRQACAAMALVTANVEPRWTSMCFSRSFVPFNLSPRQRLDDVMTAMSQVPFGGTDASLPMLWAEQNRVEVDTFVVYTDNETWAGKMHPFQALRRYREKSGIAAKLVVQAFTSTGFSIADPNDPGMLDVVGLDASAPTLVSAFSRGEF